MSKHQYSVKGQAASHYSQSIINVPVPQSQIKYLLVCYRFLFSSEENWESYGHFKFLKDYLNACDLSIK